MSDYPASVKQSVILSLMDGGNITLGEDEKSEERRVGEDVEGNGYPWTIIKRVKKKLEESWGEKKKKSQFPIEQKTTDTWPFGMCGEFIKVYIQWEQLDNVLKNTSITQENKMRRCRGSQSMCNALEAEESQNRKQNHRK